MGCGASKYAAKVADEPTEDEAIPDSVQKSLLHLTRFGPRLKGGVLT